MGGADGANGDRVCLSELIGALSLASGLAVGEPMEHALRRCLIAVRLGQALGLAEDELTMVYDLALLRSIGYWLSELVVQLFSPPPVLQVPAG